jgi:hypothetical protein
MTGKGTGTGLQGDSSDQQATSKTHLDFVPLTSNKDGTIHLRGLGTLEVWWTTIVRRWEGFCSLSKLIFGVFFRMARRRLHIEVRIRSSHSIIALVVHLESSDDMWSCVTRYRLVNAYGL